MGLLDGLLSDPAQLATIAGLLQGRQPASGLLMQYAQTQDERKRNKQAEELRALQMQQAQMDMAAKKQAQERDAQLRGLQSKFYDPGASAQPQMGPTPDGSQMPMGEARAPFMNEAGYANAAMSQGLMTPMEVAALQAKERVKVGAGETVGRYGPNGKFIPDFTAPDKPPPGFKQGPNGLVADPAYIAAQKEIRAAGRPQVSVDMKQEGRFSQEMGKHFADSYNGVLQNGAQAALRLQDLNRFSAIVEKVPTGKLEPLKAEVGRLANSLGVKVDTEKLGFQDALEAMSNQFALTLRNPSSGAGMPGAMSDKDREFLVSMVPGLGKTPNGNKMILEAFKRVAKRDAEVAQLAREYKTKTGKFDDGFYDVLAQKFGGQDLLGDLYAQAAGNANRPMGAGGTTLRFDRNGNPVGG